jgi:hypothetical protein
MKESAMSAAPPTIRVEVPREEGGLAEEGLFERSREISGEKIEEAADQASRIADILTSRLKQSAQAVSEITVEFGLSFEGKAGIPFFTEGKAGATIAITVTWDLKDTQAAGNSAGT